MSEKSSDRTPKKVRSQDDEFEHIVPLNECVILKGEAFNELWRQWKATGDQALLALILRSVFRFINTIAYKLYRPLKIPLQDAFQLGTMGALRAAEKFNPDLGFEFPTYAEHWIRQSITREAGEYEEIRFPVHAHETLRKIRQTKQHLLSELDREPTTREIAAYAKLPEEKIKKMQSYTASRESVRLEALPDEAVTVHSLQTHYAKIAADTPEGKTYNKSLRTEVLGLLKNFEYRERKILSVRALADFFDTEQLTLAQVGKIIGLSRERVRQIEKKAIDKLKVFLKERTKGGSGNMSVSNTAENRKEVGKTLLKHYAGEQIESAVLSKLVRDTLGVEAHEGVSHIVASLKEDAFISVAAGTRASTIWKIHREAIKAKLEGAERTSISSLHPGPLRIQAMNPDEPRKVFPPRPPPKQTEWKSRVSSSPLGRDEPPSEQPGPHESETTQMALAAKEPAPPELQTQNPELIVEKYGSWIDKHRELREAQQERHALEQKLEEVRKREASLKAELAEQPKEVELMVRLYDSIDARLKST